MKKILILAFALLLTACDKNNIPIIPFDPPLSSAPAIPQPEVIDVSVTAKRDTHSLMLNWSGLTANSFTLCQKTDPNFNDCIVIQKGKVSANSIELILSTDFNLEQMLSDQLYIHFYSQQGSLVGTAKLAITQEMVNAMMQYFKALDATELARFGKSVAISGDGRTIAVGASRRDLITDDHSILSAGGVYIFQELSEGWKEITTITYDNAKSYDQFGKNLALDKNGELLAVAMPGSDTADQGVNPVQSEKELLNSGAIVLFAKKDDKWIPKSLIKSVTPEAGVGFGNASLALSADGKKLAVSKPRQDQIEIFALNKQDQWQPFGIIDESSQEHNIRYGLEIDFNHDGSVLVVSAAGDGVNLSSKEPLYFVGAVFTYQLQDNIYTQIDYLQPEPLLEHSYFGSSLDLSADGHTLVVSNSKNTVYLYDFKENNWQLRFEIASPDAIGFKRFGKKIKFNEDASRLAITALTTPKAPGINSDIIEGTSDSYGMALVYHLTQQEPSLLFTLQSTHPSANDHFGSSLAFDAKGNTLVMGSSDESSNSQGINQDDTQTEDKNGSGAVMVFPL